MIDENGPLFATMASGGSQELLESVMLRMAKDDGTGEAYMREMTRRASFHFHPAAENLPPDECEQASAEKEGGKQRGMEREQALAEKRCPEEARLAAAEARRRTAMMERILAAETVTEALAHAEAGPEDELVQAPV